MRKVLTALFLLSALSAAHAQSVIGSGIFGDAKVSGGGGSVNYTKTGNPAAQAGGANPQNFTSVPIGTAASNRYVLVCVATNSGQSVSSMTVGGVSATKASGVSAGAGAASIDLWYANVTTGTTATVAITLANTFPTSVIITTATINTATAAPTTTATMAWGFVTDPHSTSSALTVPSNGVGVGCAFTQQNSAALTNSSGTLDYQTFGPTTVTSDLMMWHNSTAGSWTPTFTGSPFIGAMIASATWGP